MARMLSLLLLASSAIGALAQSAETSSGDTTLVISTSSSISTSSESESTGTMTVPDSSTTNGPITLSVYGLGNTVNTFGASVLAADQGSTIYVASCVTGRLQCINDDFTMTSASTYLQLTNVGTSRGFTVTELYSCQISGTTSASCFYSLGAQSGDTSTSGTTVTTESAATLPYATFVVTAGQEKLAAASTIPPSNTGNAAVRATIMSSSMQKGLFMTMVGSSLAVFAFAVLL